MTQEQEASFWIFTVRVVLYYYFEGIRIALCELGDRDGKQFLITSEGCRPYGEPFEPRDVRKVSWASDKSDFRDLVCSILRDLKIPQEHHDEILRALTQPMGEENSNV